MSDINEVKQDVKLKKSANAYVLPHKRNDGSRERYKSRERSRYDRNQDRTRGIYRGDNGVPNGKADNDNNWRRTNRRNSQKKVRNI